MRDLMAEIEIAVEDVSLIFVNGKSGAYNQVLEDGDKVSLLPSIGGG